MQIIINVTKENVGCRKTSDARHYRIARTFMRLGEPMRKILFTLLLCLPAPAAIALAQDKPATTASAPNKTSVTATAVQDNPLSAFNKRAYGQMKVWLLGSAEKMPVENYNFKPTEEVRSYGQIIGHIADVQYRFCSDVLGEKNPAPAIEKTKSSKAELIAALKDSFAYCDKAYNDMTDASGAQIVKHFGTDLPKLSLLNMNIAHAALHYGNLITYMRLKNIVPPSTEAMEGPKPKE